VLFDYGVRVKKLEAVLLALPAIIRIENLRGRGIVDAACSSEKLGRASMCA
jgi:hypothetical protein